MAHLGPTVPAYRYQHLGSLDLGLKGSRVDALHVQGGVRKPLSAPARRSKVRPAYPQHAASISRDRPLSVSRERIQVQQRLVSKKAIEKRYNQQAALYIAGAKLLPVNSLGRANLLSAAREALIRRNLDIAALYPPKSRKRTEFLDLAQKLLTA